MTLRPCPFCGGSASFARHGTARQSCVVTCDQCGCSHESGDVGERSGTSWNRRVSEPEERVILPVPE